MERKKFCLSDVLSITTGRNLSSGGTKRTNDMLAFMAGGDLGASGIGAEMYKPDCHKWLIEKYPELVKASSVESISKLCKLLEIATSNSARPEDAVEEWLNWVTETYKLQPEYEVDYRCGYASPIHEVIETACSHELP